MANIRISNFKNRVCATCLSVDRKLFTIGNDKYSSMLRHLVVMTDSEKICWECKALIFKVVAFQIKASTARTILIQIYQHLKLSEIVTLTPLSSLKSCDLHPESIESTTFQEPVFTSSIDCYNDTNVGLEKLNNGDESRYNYKVTTRDRASEINDEGRWPSPSITEIDTDEPVMDIKAEMHSFVSNVLSSEKPGEVTVDDLGQYQVATLIDIDKQSLNIPRSCGNVSNEQDSEDGYGEKSDDEFDQEIKPPENTSNWNDTRTGNNNKNIKNTVEIFIKSDEGVNMLHEDSNEITKDPLVTNEGHTKSHEDHTMLNKNMIFKKESDSFIEEDGISDEDLIVFNKNPIFTEEPEIITDKTILNKTPNVNNTPNLLNEDPITLNKVYLTFNEVPVMFKSDLILNNRKKQKTEQVLEIKERNRNSCQKCKENFSTIREYKNHKWKHVKMQRAYIMNKNSLSKRQFKWNTNSFETALECIKLGVLTVQDAACVYRIPEKSLQQYKMRNCKKVPKEQSAFGMENEIKFANYIKNIQAKGFTITEDDLHEKALQFAEYINITDRLKRFERKAGKTWMNMFLKRHPQIITRKSEKDMEGIEYPLNRGEVDAYYKLLRSVLKENYIMNKSNRIFKIEKTNLQINNCIKGVLRENGLLTPFDGAPAENEGNIGLIGCYNADGMYLPPACIVQGQNRLSREFDNMPKGSKIFISETSTSMTPNIFLEWLKTIFLPRKPKGKCLFLLDDHMSQCISFEIFEFANDNGIIFLSMPNCVLYYLETLNKYVLKPFQSEFCKEVAVSIMQNSDQRILTFSVGKLLCSAWMRIAKTRRAITTFKAIGIVPFNPKVILDEDYPDISEKTLGSFVSSTMEVKNIPDKSKVDTNVILDDKDSFVSSTMEVKNIPNKSNVDTNVISDDKDIFKKSNTHYENMKFE